LISSILGAYLPYRQIVLERYLSWQLPFYQGYVNYSLVCIVLTLIFSKYILRQCRKIICWLYVAEYRRERYIIFSFCLIFFFTFQTNAHWGFWWQGIPGWTEVKDEVLVPLTEEEMKVSEIYEDDHFLWKGINKDVANYINIPAPLKTEGRVMMLHFENGEVLPFNWGIFGYVFPQYMFGWNFESERTHRVMPEVIKERLNRLRNGGQGFLLPEEIAYPSHAAYLPIDYKDYPSPDTLTEISYWQVLLGIFPDRRVEILTANKTDSIVVGQNL